MNFMMDTGAEHSLVTIPVAPLTGQQHLLLEIQGIWQPTHFARLIHVS